MLAVFFTDPVLAGFDMHNGVVVAAVVVVNQYHLVVVVTFVNHHHFFGLVGVAASR